jgi:hypothetical protein
MVARHRALAHLTRHSNVLIHPSYRGTESFWIHRFLSDQVGLSVVGHAAHCLTTWACKAVRYWGFESWSSHASLPDYFWLSVQAVRWCSHLARPCEVFHNWDGKTCSTLIDRSHDAWLKSGDTTGVVTSTGIKKCIRSRDIRPESCLSTRVEHTTGVTTYLHYKYV